MTGKKKMLQKR